MQKTLALLALLFALIAPGSLLADEPVLHPPAKIYPTLRWAPAATDYEGLLWNDWSPACYEGIYGPGWGGWWYMYFGHYYSPYFTPYLHKYPYCHYTHPYYNYPLDSENQHWYIGLGNNLRPMVDYGVRYERDLPQSSRPTPAKVIVTLPADAKLIVNGEETALTSGERVFTTPELKPGKDYYYVVRAEVVRDGEVKSLEREVTVAAGRESKVNFELPSSSTARK